jgi:hypothetical protein
VYRGCSAPLPTSTPPQSLPTFVVAFLMIGILTVVK